MMRRTWTWLALASAAGLSIVACGGGDGPGAIDVGDAGDGGTDATTGTDASDASTGDDGAADASGDALADGGRTLDGGACGGPNFSVTSVNPVFGWTGGKTSLSIHGAGFVATPAVFLRSSTGALTQLVHAAYVSSTSIVAEIDPSLSLAAGTYDVGVMNPDTCAAFDANAFKLVATPPPSDVNVSPAAGTTKTDTTVTITACDLPAAGSITLSTIDASGAVKPQTINAASLTCTASSACAGGQSCTLGGTIASSALTAGLYVVRVGNSANGTWGDFASFVVTDPSGKLGVTGTGWTAASSMNVGRRGLQVVSARIDAANRFLYAVGGEDANGAALDSVEVAPLDEFGRVGDWFVQRSHLTAPRSAHAVVRQGKYLYALGGTSTANGGKGDSPSGTALDTIERAKILDPAEAPQITAAATDATDGGALAKGTWYYKVAAVLNGNDADNPNGETLPSDEAIVNLSAAGSVKLTWKASTNANVDHYVVYRSPTANATSGSEQLVNPNVSGLTWTDGGEVGDGGDAGAPIVPQRRGATTKWQVVASGGSTLHMLHARLNTAAAVAPDGAGGLRIHVVGGWGSCGGGAPALMACTESVAIDATGATLTGPFAAGGNLTAARMRHGLAAVTSANGPADAGAPATTGFLLVGGGYGGSASSSPPVEYVVSAATGLWQTASTTFNNRDAVQVAVVNGWAYAFMGGKQPPYNGTSDLAALTSDTAATLTLGSWSSTSQPLPNNAGIGRFGLAIESAYFYAVGGTSDENDALKTVYQIVY